MDRQTLYDKLATTAKAHLNTCLPKTHGSNDPDAGAILSYLDPSFRIDFGHKFFVSTAPGLQGEKTGDGFVAHISGMVSKLQTYSLDVTNVCVDVEKRTVVLRVDFHMVPKGGEVVLNDIVFWMVMDESGEKVLKYTEFVDPIASTELAKRMKEANEK